MCVFVESFCKRNPFDHLAGREGLVWGKYQLEMCLAFCSSNTCLLTELDLHMHSKKFLKQTFF